MIYTRIYLHFRCDPLYEHYQQKCSLLGN